MVVKDRELAWIDGTPVWWLTVDGDWGPEGDTRWPASCGCEDCEQYPPEVIEELKDYGHLKVRVFRHTNEKAKVKRCMMAADTRAPFAPLSFEQYMRYWQS
jgi:hypothetical protein